MTFYMLYSLSQACYYFAQHLTAPYAYIKYKNIGVHTESPPAPPLLECPLINNKSQLFVSWFSHHV